MKFFLDTANLADIKKYAEWGIVDGVTTNPTLIAKEKVSLETRIKEIARVIDGPISSEVIAEDAEGMLNEARKYAKWHRNVYVKFPMTVEGLKALKLAKKRGIKVNMTLVFSASQAILAAKAGADLISPFVGRLDDISENGMGLIKDLTEIWKHYEFKSQILVASVRNPEHVIESAKLGAHIATMPPVILEALISHPLTDKGVAQFLADWKKVKKLQA